MTDIIFPSLSEFRAWLERMPGNAVAGFARAACDCPLAKCLEARGAISPTVVPGPVPGGDWSAYNMSTTSLPSWADDFGVRVDEGRPCWRPVTAAECLSILSDLTE